MSMHRTEKMSFFLSFFSCCVWVRLVFRIICLAVPAGTVWHFDRLLQRCIQSTWSGPGIQTSRLPSSQWRFLCLCRPWGPLLDWLFHLSALLQESGPCDRITSQVGGVKSHTHYTRLKLLLFWFCFLCFSHLLFSNPSDKNVGKTAQNTFFFSYLS